MTRATRIPECVRQRSTRAIRICTPNDGRVGSPSSAASGVSVGQVDLGRRRSAEVSSAGLTVVAPMMLRIWRMDFRTALRNAREGVVTLPRACTATGGPVARRMNKIGYAGYRFLPEIVHQAVWLYLRFTLSFRDVEDLLAERGVTVSYETIRRWVNHFGPMIAADLRKRRRQRAVETYEPIVT
jgi:hypothetical protein